MTVFLKILHEGLRVCGKKLEDLMNSCTVAVEKLIAMYNKNSKASIKYQPSLYDVFMWMYRKVAFKSGKKSLPNKEAKSILEKLR